MNFITLIKHDLFQKINISSVLQLPLHLICFKIFQQLLHILDMLSV